jgi:hypothetical protein
MRRPKLAARREAGAGLDGTLDDHVGCEVGKNGFDMGKIKRARDVLGGVVKDHGDIDRQGAEHPERVGAHEVQGY